MNALLGDLFGEYYRVTMYFDLGGIPSNILL